MSNSLFRSLWLTSLFLLLVSWRSSPAQVTCLEESMTNSSSTVQSSKLVPAAAILTKSTQQHQSQVNKQTVGFKLDSTLTQLSTTTTTTTTAPTHKWSTVTKGQQDSMQYRLSCSLDRMSIEVNVSTIQDPTVYLERLKSFSICKPKFHKQIAIFDLPLDEDNFYRCGTTKVHDQHTDTRIYYNRVIVESKQDPNNVRSIYFKCSLPTSTKLTKLDPTSPTNSRSKRQSPSSSNPWIHGPTGQLVNFTEIDLPENFMEAEILDFTDNITASAPYPHLNIKVKRNGQLVNTSLNVAPGTPLEMIIYLDEESRSVYGLLTSFLKVTDTTSRQQEVIVLNGCSIDPYIFSNFETDRGGDEVSAKFRAFKFPESNYVMFIGTVNVCLDRCAGVPCGSDGLLGYGRRRRRRRSSPLPGELPKDPNKVFEIEMSTYLQIGYSQQELELKKESLRGSSMSENPNPSSPSKLTDSSSSIVSQQFQAYTSNLGISHNHSKMATLCLIALIIIINLVCSFWQL